MVVKFWEQDIFLKIRYVTNVARNGKDCECGIFFWIWFNALWVTSGLKVLTLKNPWKKKNDMTYCTYWLIIINKNCLIYLSIMDSIYFTSFVIYAELTSHMALCKIHKECWNFVFLACPLCLGSKVVTEVLWKFFQCMSWLLDTT